VRDSLKCLNPLAGSEIPRALVTVIADHLT
jgi:hypothetical protein